MSILRDATVFVSQKAEQTPPPAPPRPLQLMLVARSQHRHMPLVSQHTIIVPKHIGVAACCHPPVGMRAKRSAYECMESGIQGRKSLAGGTGARPPLAARRVGELHPST